MATYKADSRYQELFESKQKELPTRGKQTLILESLIVVPSTFNKGSGEYEPDCYMPADIHKNAIANGTLLDSVARDTKNNYDKPNDISCKRGILVMTCKVPEDGQIVSIQVTSQPLYQARVAVQCIGVLDKQIFTTLVEAFAKNIEGELKDPNMTERLIWFAQPPSDKKYEFRTGSRDMASATQNYQATKATYDTLEKVLKKKGLTVPPYGTPFYIPPDYTEYLEAFQSRDMHAELEFNKRTSGTSIKSITKSINKQSYHAYHVIHKTDSIVEALRVNLRKYERDGKTVIEDPDNLGQMSVIVFTLFSSEALKFMEFLLHKHLNTWLEKHWTHNESKPLIRVCLSGSVLNGEHFDLIERDAKLETKFGSEVFYQQFSKAPRVKNYNSWNKISEQAQVALGAFPIWKWWPLHCDGDLTIPTRAGIPLQSLFQLDMGDLKLATRRVSINCDHHFVINDTRGFLLLDEKPSRFVTVTRAVDIEQQNADNIDEYTSSRLESRDMMFPAGDRKVPNVVFAEVETGANTIHKPMQVLCFTLKESDPVADLFENVEYQRTKTELEVDMLHNRHNDRHNDMYYRLATDLLLKVVQTSGKATDEISSCDAVDSLGNRARVFFSTSVNLIDQLILRKMLIFKNGYIAQTGVVAYETHVRQSKYKLKAVYKNLIKIVRAFPAANVQNNLVQLITILKQSLKLVESVVDKAKLWVHDDDTRGLFSEEIERSLPNQQLVEQLEEIVRDKDDERIKTTYEGLIDSIHSSKHWLFDEVNWFKPPNRVRNAQYIFVSTLNPLEISSAPWREETLHFKKFGISIPSVKVVECDNEIDFYRKIYFILTSPGALVAHNANFDFTRIMQRAHAVFNSKANSSEYFHHGRAMTCIGLVLGFGQNLKVTVDHTKMITKEIVDDDDDDDDTNADGDGGGGGDSGESEDSLLKKLMAEEEKRTNWGDTYTYLTRVTSNIVDIEVPCRIIADTSRLPLLNPTDIVNGRTLEETSKLVLGSEFGKYKGVEGKLVTEYILWRDALPSVAIYCCMDTVLTLVMSIVRLLHPKVVASQQLNGVASSVPMKAQTQSCEATTMMNVRGLCEGWYYTNSNMGPIVSKYAKWLGNKGGWVRNPIKSMIKCVPENKSDPEWLKQRYTAEFWAFRELRKLMAAVGNVLDFSSMYPNILKTLRLAMNNVWPGPGAPPDPENWDMRFIPLCIDESLFKKTATETEQRLVKEIRESFKEWKDNSSGIDEVAYAKEIYEVMKRGFEMPKEDCDAMDPFYQPYIDKIAELNSRVVYYPVYIFKGKIGAMNEVTNMILKLRKGFKAQIVEVEAKIAVVKGEMKAIDLEMKGKSIQKTCLLCKVPFFEEADCVQISACECLYHKGCLHSLQTVGFGNYIPTISCVGCLSSTVSSDLVVLESCCSQRVFDAYQECRIKHTALEADYSDIVTKEGASKRKANSLYGLYVTRGTPNCHAICGSGTTDRGRQDNMECERMLRSCLQVKDAMRVVLQYLYGEGKCYGKETNAKMFSAAQSALAFCVKDLMHPWLISRGLEQDPRVESCLHLDEKDPENLALHMENINSLYTEFIVSIMNGEDYMVIFYGDTDSMMCFMTWCFFPPFCANEQHLRAWGAACSAASVALLADSDRFRATTCRMELENMMDARIVDICVRKRGIMRLWKLLNWEAPKFDIKVTGYDIKVKSLPPVYYDILHQLLKNIIDYTPEQKLELVKKWLIELVHASLLPCSTMQKTFPEVTCDCEGRDTRFRDIRFLSSRVNINPCTKAMSKAQQLTRDQLARSGTTNITMKGSEFERLTNVTSYGVVNSLIRIAYTMGMGELGSMDTLQFPMNQLQLVPVEQVDVPQVGQPSFLYRKKEVPKLIFKDGKFSVKLGKDDSAAASRFDCDEIDTYWMVTGDVDIPVVVDYRLLIFKAANSIKKQCANVNTTDLQRYFFKATNAIIDLRKSKRGCFFHASMSMCEAAFEAASPENDKIEYYFIGGRHTSIRDAIVKLHDEHGMQYSDILHNESTNPRLRAQALCGLSFKTWLRFAEPIIASLEAERKEEKKIQQQIKKAKKAAAAAAAAAAPPTPQSKKRKSNKTLSVECDEEEEEVEQEVEQDSAVVKKRKLPPTASEKKAAAEKKREVARLKEENRLKIIAYKEKHIPRIPTYVDSLVASLFKSSIIAKYKIIITKAGFEKDNIGANTIGIDFEEWKGCGGVDYVKDLLEKEEALQESQCGEKRKNNNDSKQRKLTSFFTSPFSPTA